MSSASTWPERPAGTDRPEGAYPAAFAGVAPTDLAFAQQPAGYRDVAVHQHPVIGSAPATGYPAEPGYSGYPADPGDATGRTRPAEPARPPRRPAGRLKLFLASWALVFLVIPAWVGFSLLVTSVASAIAWVGLFLWLGTAGVLRGVSGAHRKIAGCILGEKITTSYRKGGSGVFGRLRVVLTDPARWRDVAFMFYAISLGFAISLSALIAFFIFPIGYWLSPLLLRLQAVTTRTLVGPSGEAALQQRIGQLEESRSESVDHSAAELRRIERDLHDGAQAQLVALGMNLGLAEDLVTRDPKAAAALIADARTSSRTALAELRSLVRGIHPPVLADRGLTGGIEALALAHPRPVEVDVQLAGRPPAPVESAVYFAVAEALTNSAKYSSAQTTWIWLRHDGTVLTALVGDDGVGNARITPGGGLAGLERRLAAFDGTLSLASPSGGPTIVTITVPCALTS
ncbi:MAG TPA: histidine kinase [Nakamurella sp.]|nr:histidine kinase [Nakamurella sp.]